MILRSVIFAIHYFMPMLPWSGPYSSKHLYCLLPPHLSQAPLEREPGLEGEENGGGHFLR